MNDSPMRAQVFTKADLIAQMVPEMQTRAANALSDGDCRRIEALYLCGCGDSHHASLATELAFQRWTGLPVKALTSMQFARYESAHLRPGAAVFSTSVSGEVSRTIECAVLARRAGALTVACTGTPASRIAQAAERVMPIGTPPGPAGPGVRSYTASLLGLYMLALRIAEVRGSLSATAVRAQRDALSAAAGAVHATAEAADAPAARLAEQTKSASNYVFVGHGPNVASALFNAAKIMEASGDHAQGQDTEEWAHLQYFVADPATPSFLIAPPGSGYSRAAELVSVLKRLGRPTIAIAAESDRAMTEKADAVLPLRGTFDEALSPLVACTPGELFAAHLAAVKGVAYFRGFAGPWDRALGGNGIRTSPIAEALEE